MITLEHRKIIDEFEINEDNGDLLIDNWDWKQTDIFYRSFCLLNDGMFWTECGVYPLDDDFTRSRVLW